jgi:hypothetical protein
MPLAVNFFREWTYELAHNFMDHIRRQNRTKDDRRSHWRSPASGPVRRYSIAIISAVQTDIFGEQDPYELMSRASKVTILLGAGIAETNVPLDRNASSPLFSPAIARLELRPH